jgi:two-component system sensor histidine kinase FlrB
MDGVPTPGATIGATIHALSGLPESHIKPVTGIHRQDQEPRAMTQHLRALLDAIPGCVIVINSHGNIVDFNRAASELLGDPLSQQMWRDVVARVFLSELDQGELRTADGRQFSISTRPLGYEPGQILLLSDVTQTRHLQRAAQQNLHLMTMGKMMASLAHQIRTPLSSSMLYLSQIVDSDLDPEKSKKFSTKALARIKHIESMINDMLVFAHGGEFHMSDFKLADLLQELSDQIQPYLQQHQARLKIDNPHEQILINGNKGALLGAVANLCMNAIDARRGAPRINITISLTKRGDLQLLVADNGEGMEQRILEHLFDPFFTTKMDGTGLGLAVVKSVIESHQGSISATSTPGEGSCFEIHLPCLQGSRTQLSKHRKEEK